MKQNRSLDAKKQISILTDLRGIGDLKPLKKNYDTLLVILTCTCTYFNVLINVSVEGTISDYYDGSPIYMKFWGKLCLSGFLI